METNISAREAFDNATYKQAADKIRQLLSAIRNNPATSAKRWVWELMQNAKDIPNKFGKVSVEIELVSETELQFRHNGDPFVIGNITGLIRQVSSKDSLNSDDETTGKFGTGFICTHLLSDTIDVSGILNYKGYRRFKLSLDRSGRSSEELIPRIRDVEKIFLEPEKFFNEVSDYELLRKESDFDTIFTYHLTSEEKLNSAKAGLDDLVNTLPITLVTQAKKIKQIRVIDRVRGTDVTYMCTSQDVDNFVTFSEIKINSDIKQFLSYITSDVALTIEVIKESNGVYQLQKRDSKQPVLYRDFPLIGSELFYFPYTLNGFKLCPTEKRNSIPLNGEDNEEAKDNRAIIEHAIETAVLFNQWLIAHNSVNRYLLAYSRRPKAEVEYDDRVAKPWIENLQKSWRKQLLSQELVETSSGTCTLADVSVPIFERSKENRELFYNLVAENYIGRGVLPVFSSLHGWIEVISAEYETWDATLKYEIEDLLTDISNAQNLNNLSTKAGKTDTEITQWLNKIYVFLVTNNLTSLLNDYAVMPNQNGDFKLLDELTSDHTKRIPPKLKMIYNEVVDDNSYIENHLLDSRIDAVPFGSTIAVYNLDNIIASLNTLIKDGGHITKKDAIIDISEHLSYRIISIFPDSQDKTVVARREAIYKFSASYRAMPTNENIVIEGTDLWREADNYWFNHSFEAIEKFNDVTALSSSFFVQEKTTEQTLNWLNEYIGFYRNNAQGDLIKSHRVFPNQKLELRKLDELHYDNNIDEEYKTLAEYISSPNSTNDIYRPILLHRVIKGYELHSPYSLADIYNDITNAFDNNPALREQIATQTIILLPQDKSDNASFTQLYNFAKDLFGESIPEQKIVSSSVGFKWGYAQKFFIRKIGTAIAGYATITNLQESIDSLKSLPIESVSQWVDSFIEFVREFKQKRYWDIITDADKGIGIWLNQKGEFCRFQDVRLDRLNSEELKDIALNKWVNIDYRESLFNNSSSISHYLETTPLSIEEVGHAIDKKLEEYDGDKQNKEFAALVFSVGKLCNSIPELKNSMLWFIANKNSLIVGSLGEGETMNLVGALIQSGDEKLRLAKAIIDGYSLESLQKLLRDSETEPQIIDVANKDGEQVQISLSDTQYGGLSTDAMADALIEAKRLVKSLLESQGFDFTEGLCESSYGNIYGVFRNGIEYPLVVHSYKWQTRPFQLTAFDWEQLAKPNSMLWVNTYDGLKCVPFYALAHKRGTINISFDCSNFEYADRSKALAQVLRYYKGLHFDFGSLLPACTNQVEMFNQPEKPLSEALCADADSLLK